MTDTGHNDRTKAIVEQINKKHETHTTTREIITPETASERMSKDWIDWRVKASDTLEELSAWRSTVQQRLQELQKHHNALERNIRQLDKTMAHIPEDRKADLEALQRAISEVSTALITDISQQSQRIAALEQRFADLPIELAHMQKERRS